MPMRATTVRFSEDLWRLLEREAGDQGVSAAPLIRDATILRVAVLAERRGDREARLTLEDLAAGALRTGERDQPAALPGVRGPGAAGGRARHRAARRAAGPRARPPRRAGSEGAQRARLDGLDHRRGAAVLRE